MITGYDAMLDTLYEEHYRVRKSSEVTSSHWREVGGHEVSKTDGGFDMHGFGFGNRLRNSFIYRILTLPELVATPWLVRKYSSSARFLQEGRAVAKRQDMLFGYDCLRQVLAVGFVCRQFDKEESDLPLSSHGIRRVCVIGDGYGYIGSLLKLIDPAIQVLSINLGRTLFFDAAYTKMVHQSASAALLRDLEDVGSGDASGKDFLFLEAERYELLQQLEADIFINIASMQEMNINVVQNYMRFIRSQKGGDPYFYCCNRIEKQLPDGALIRLADYGWDHADEMLVDELCPWYQCYPAWTWKFWAPFDGPIQHRFVKLKRN